MSEKKPVGANATVTPNKSKNGNGNANGNGNGNAPLTPNKPKIENANENANVNATVTPNKPKNGNANENATGNANKPKNGNGNGNAGKDSREASLFCAATLHRFGLPVDFARLKAETLPKTCACCKAPLWDSTIPDSRMDMIFAWQCHLGRCGGDGR